VYTEGWNFAVFDVIAIYFSADCRGMQIDRLKLVGGNEDG
jgi:hypothetical protein